MSNSYDVGDAVRVSTSTPFQDAGGTPFDPDVVRGKVKDPSGNVKVYVLSPSAEQGQLVQDGTGDYHFDIDVDEKGGWKYRIEGETSAGAKRGAAEGYFRAFESGF